MSAKNFLLPPLLLLLPNHLDLNSPSELSAIIWDHFVVRVLQQFSLNLTGGFGTGQSSSGLIIVESGAS